jgi:hypothetical protein
MPLKMTFDVAFVVTSIQMRLYLILDERERAEKMKLVKSIQMYLILDEREWVEKRT